MANVGIIESLLARGELVLSKIHGDLPEILEVTDAKLPELRKKVKAEGKIVVRLDGDRVETKKLPNGGFISKGFYGSTRVAIIPISRTL
jgi:hypothetical protein